MIPNYLRWSSHWTKITMVKLITGNPGLKISVSDASDKMSSVFGLGSDIFEMMSGGFSFSLW